MGRTTTGGRPEPPFITSKLAVSLRGPITARMSTIVPGPSAWLAPCTSQHGGHRRPKATPHLGVFSELNAASVVQRLLLTSATCNGQCCFLFLPLASVPQAFVPQAPVFWRVSSGVCLLEFVYPELCAPSPQCDRLRRAVPRPPPTTLLKSPVCVVVLCRRCEAVSERL